MNKDLIAVYGFMFRPRLDFNEKSGLNSNRVERIKNCMLGKDGVSFVISLRYGLDIPYYLKTNR